MLELMIVVAIMGIVLAMGIPSFARMLRREGMSKAVREVVEVCSTARRWAIMSGSAVELRIHPKDGNFSVGGVASAPKEGADSASAPPSQAYDGGSASSAQLPDSVKVEGCGVNFIDFTDAEEAVVRFYPNGTSDEFTLVLLGDNNERRKITLEVVTALADVGDL